MNDTDKPQTDPNYPHFGCLSFAVFNCRPTHKDAGKKAVIKAFGPQGWTKVKRLMKTGIMELFHHPPIPETRLYAETVGKLADKYWSKRQAPKL